MEDSIIYDDCIIYDEYIKDKKIFRLNELYNDSISFVNQYGKLFNIYNLEKYDIISYKIKKKIIIEDEIIYNFNDVCEVICDFNINSDNINNDNISIQYNPPCLKDNINRFLNIGFINNYLIIKKLSKNKNINITITYTCYLIIDRLNFIKNIIINNTQFFIGGMVISTDEYYNWGTNKKLREFILNYT